VSEHWRARIAPSELAAAVVAASRRAAIAYLREHGVGQPQDSNAELSGGAAGLSDEPATALRQLLDLTRRVRAAADEVQADTDRHGPAVVEVRSAGGRVELVMAGRQPSKITIDQIWLRSAEPVEISRELTRACRAAKVCPTTMAVDEQTGGGLTELHSILRDQTAMMRRLGVTGETSRR
jgi:hypothetical protein